MRPPLFLFFSLLIGLAAGAGVPVEVIRVDGTIVRGELLKADSEIQLETPDGPLSIDWSDVLEVARPAAATRDDSTQPPASAPAPRLQFELTDGTRVAAAIESADEREIRLRGRADLPLSFRPSLLRSILASDADEAAREALRNASSDTTQTEDVAVVANSGRQAVLSGAVRRIETARLVFAWKDRELPVAWDRVAGLVLARPASKEAGGVLRMQGGDAIAGRVISADEQSIEVRTGWVDSLRVPWSRVVRIENRSNRVVWLSDLQPLGYEFDPFFSRKWPLGVDRSLLGGSIEVDGRAYGKGLVLHSRARAGFNIGGAFRQFAATVGISSELKGLGNARAAILGDGRVLWEAAELRGGVPAQRVVVDLAGIRTLELQVDYGEDLDQADHVVFALARLVR